MRKEDIISKGKYSYPQPEQLISVKEYLFVRNEEGKKMLLLRFANKRAETCTSFGFILYRLDARGRILGEERFESSDGRKYKANATFGFDRKVEVEEKCVEFKIKLLYATYGEYAYKVENGDTVVDFKEKQVAPIIPNSTVLAGDGKIKPRKIIYISCNSATLARDAAILKEKGYKMDKCTPVDMFPETTHVECCVLMQIV